MSRRNARYRFLIFDLDETLYSPGTGLMKTISQRISQYMERRMGLPPLQVKLLRQKYYTHYGTTMRGLIVHYHIDPEDYLSYVHDIPLDEYLAPDPELREVLQAVPLERVIFTNSTVEHARQVLRHLGIEDLFTRIVDVRAVDYMSKPALRSYRRLLDILGTRGETCIFADDRVHNLCPAKELGMITVLVNDNQPDDADCVDFTIARAAEIARVLEALGISVHHNESLVG